MNNHFWRVTFFYKYLGSVFPFVQWVYACPFPLYFLQFFQHEDFIVIFSKFSTWQGDLLGKTLFILTHFCGFHIITIAHPTYVFLSIVDGMHIVGLVLDMMSTFLWIQTKVYNIKIFHSIDEMCNLVFKKIMFVHITSFRFSYTQHRFCILSTLVCSIAFVESFVT
jgi:hypothetical protein